MTQYRQLQLKSFLVQDNILPSLNSQYHYCWCPGEARIQCISSHDIGIVKLGDCLAYLWCPYVSFFIAISVVSSCIIRFQQNFSLNFESFPNVFSCRHPIAADADGGTQRNKHIKTTFWRNNHLFITFCVSRNSSFRGILCIQHSTPLNSLIV